MQMDTDMKFCKQQSFCIFFCVFFFLGYFLSLLILVQLISILCVLFGYSFLYFLFYVEGLLLLYPVCLHCLVFPFFPTNLSCCCPGNHL